MAGMTTADIMERAFEELQDAIERVDDARNSEKKRSPGASVSALILAENRIRGALTHIVSARKELNAKANEPHEERTAKLPFAERDGKSKASGKD